MLKAHSGCSRLTAGYRLADPLLRSAIRRQRPACGDVEAAGVSFHSSLDARNDPKDTFSKAAEGQLPGSASIVHRRHANWQEQERSRALPGAPNQSQFDQRVLPWEGSGEVAGFQAFQIRVAG